MSDPTHPFLRVQILKFQLNHRRQPVDLNEVETKIEIREKNQSTGSTVRVKKPIYSEENQCIRFDARLLTNAERSISIRISYHDVLYTLDTDSKALHRLADGYRHQVNFNPKAQAEVIVRYKDPSRQSTSQSRVKRLSQRYAERFQPVQKHFGHRFIGKVFKTPKFCSICSDILWGFTYKGFQCQLCDCVIHKDCYARCVHPCTGKKYSNIEATRAHQFEQQTFSLQALFCDHDGSFIRPGHAFRCSECRMVVHRRCRSKVGDYCGCKDSSLEMYEQWKENHRADVEYTYQYNEDLCEIYTKMNEASQANGTREALQRVSKVYRAKVTQGFDLSQIGILRTLGQGMTGSVYLVNCADSFYAMKTLRKNLVLEGQNLAYIQSERDILTRCRHNPFIIQLLFAFQNAERLFFLLEVAQAGTLFNLLDHQAPRPFRQEQIVFFTGEVACALMFLHSKRIIYRDLKPENIFIFDDGHVKLGDFGLSKENVDETHRTRTLCGTAEYIAYEIYNKDAYDQHVDWWSLGVLIFELSTFQTPFYANNSADITQNVLQNTVNFPRTMRDDTKEIVGAFLERDPRLRLGNHRSPHGALKDQPFFSKPFTFDAIEARRVPPPWTPTTLVPLKSSIKVPQLSEIDPKDKVLLLSAPADAFRNFSYVSPEANSWRRSDGF